MFGSKYNYDRFTRNVLLKDVATHRFGGPQAGDKAPDFKVKSLDGETIQLSDFRGSQNVVLTFGSATCPATAGSIRGLNQLYDEYSDDDVQFLFAYVREAHPGDKLPAHRSDGDKKEAAELLREEENIEMPILVDDVDGRLHRKYGSMPNSTYIIDKSGRVAFRSQWTRPSRIQAALDELLDRQEETGDEHVIVRGGADNSVPMRYGLMYSHRALGRAGDSAVQDFKEAMGRSGRVALATSRVAEPLVLNPGKAFAGAAIAGGVIVAALLAGISLRQRRMAMRSPYDVPRPKRRERSTGEYEAVGI
ncbi:MAG TPA: redoxin domain-containing protein [Terriglobales bacterium]|nr:redoxin domain-containing protein [Terriglobales bacterium]